MEAFRTFAAMVLSFALCLAAVTPVAARPACFWALKSACGASPPNGPAVRACIQSHAARLKRACRETLPRIIAVTRQCETDKQRFCGHVARASAIPSCMNRHLRKVSRACGKALSAAGVRGALGP